MEDFDAQDQRGLFQWLSHEIAGQLTLIAGFTQLAQEQLESGNVVGVKEHLAVVQEATDRASKALRRIREELRRT